MNREKVTVGAQDVADPSRRALLCALVVLSNAQEGPAAHKAGAHLAARLLGVGDCRYLEEASEVTVVSVAALRSEVAGAACPSGAEAERVLSYIEDQVCVEWKLWSEFPGSAPKPEHDRGCAARSGAGGSANPRKPK